MLDDADNLALVCEQCGYPIAGLDENEPCPECGTDTRTSRPEYRPGSPWQQSPSLAAWAATNLAILFHPLRTFRCIRIEPTRSGTLLGVNILAAAVLHSFAIAPTLRPTANAGRLTLVIPVYTLIPACYAVLLVLTSIERAGIQFFGRRRGWRIDPLASMAICGHASVGWIVGGVLSLIGWAVGSRISLPQWTFTTPYATLTTGGPERLAAALIGAALGLLIFEALVYVGVRRCRFANRIPPHITPVEDPSTGPARPNA